MVLGFHRFFVYSQPGAKISHQLSAPRLGLAMTPGSTNRRFQEETNACQGYHDQGCDYGDAEHDHQAIGERVD